MPKPSLEKPNLEKVVDQPSLLTNLDTYKKNIQEIKTSVEQVKQQIDTVEKGKDSLAKEVLEQKQKEIEAKKIEITDKKKETLELITKIKIDAKLAALDKQVSQEVDDDEKYLNTLDINSGSFWEKIKAVPGKVWEWSKENPKTAVAVTLWWILAVRWISKLFKKKDKSENKESDDKEEKPSWWKKALMWTGISVGGVLVWKNWDKIKDKVGDFWNWLTGEKDPKKTCSYENLPEETKKKYAMLANDIDTSSASNKVSFSDKLDEDSSKKWSIIFGLDKSTKNLSEFGTTDTLNYISGKTDRDVVDMWLDWLKAKWYDIIGPYLTSLASFANFLPDFATDPLKAITEWLKGGVDREKELSLYFREYVNILNYVTDKKKLLLERMAKAEIMGKDHLKDEPNAQQKESIDKLVKSDDWSKGKLATYSLVDVPALIGEYAIEASEDSEEVKKIREHVRKERDDLIEKDDKWETTFSRAETDFLDGSLSEWTRKELTGVCENLLDDAFGTDNKRWFFEAYTHLITDVFAGNTDLAEQFKQKTEIQSLIDEIRANLILYIEKLKNNSFTKEDLQSLKTQTQTYFEKKEYYEVSMESIKWANSGLDPKDIALKIVELPYHAILDIGKAFGMGKTNSWRERIGYGLGGFYVTGQTLYIASKLKSESLTKTALRIGGKTFIEVGKLPVTIGQKALNLALDRTFLTPYAWNDYILKSGFNGAEKERLLKYAFLKWEIDENRALHIAEELWSKTIKNVDALLTEFGMTDPAYREMFKKYGSDKNLRKLMFEKDKLKPRTWWKKIQYTVKDRVLRYDMEINEEAFKSLKTIDASLTTGSKESSALMRGFLSTTKDLRSEMVQELLTTKVFNVSEAEAVGRALGKNMHTFASLEDFKAYQTFFKTHYASHPSEAFVENTVRRWETIKKLDSVKQDAFIAEKSLDKSFLQRRLVAMRDNFKKSADALRKAKNRSPYPQQVEETAQSLQDLSQVDEWTVTAMQSAEEMWSAEWMMTMSKNKKLIQELSPLFKDKAFVKALGEAKTSEAIKEVFKSFNKESLFSKLSPEFTETLAKTGNTRKILDTMNYVDKYESLGKVMKILQNPTMKYASRIFGRVVWVAGFALGAFSAYSKFNEAAEIAKTNQERADVKKTDAMFETGYAVAWGIEALWAFGALAGVESVCAFIPGIGWVAGWIILWASYFVKDVVFETLDKYNKNYKDLLGHAPLLIKQHILTSILGSDKTDVAFGDWLVGSFKDLSYLTKKTWSEWIKALLYTEEWKRNPLAMVDISNPEMMAQLANGKPPVSREDVAKAIDDVEQRVVKRYAYLKVKCGTYREGNSEYIDVKKGIPTNIIAGQRWIRALDQLIVESQYSVDNPEMFETPNQLALKKQTLKASVDKSPTLCKKLDTLWATDPKMLMYMYRYANDFKSHVEQFGTQDTEYTKILANISYFNDYMLFNSLARGTDISSQSQWFGEPNFITCREFFLAYGLSKPLASTEIYGWVSKVQTALYRIATEVIGARVPVNTMDELKSVFSEANEKAYGLYFKGGDLNKLCVNGNYLSDAEYPWTTRDILVKLRADVAQKVQSNDLIDIGTWDEILNKEIGNKYLAIMDQEIRRP